MAGKRGVKRERTYGLRSRVWWLLRKNNKATLDELMMVLNDGSYKQIKNNIGYYLKRLTEVGVLEREKVSDGKVTSNGVYRYQLVNDLGYKNPLIRKDGVYDPNGLVFLSCPHPHAVRENEGNAACSAVNVKEA